MKPPLWLQNFFTGLRVGISERRVTPSWIILVAVLIVIFLIWI